MYILTEPYTRVVSLDEFCALCQKNFILVQKQDEWKADEKYKIPAGQDLCKAKRVLSPTLP